MKIVILCNDTRGGIQPYVALAQGLRNAGHRTTAIAPVKLCWLFEAYGIPVLALPATERADELAAGGLAERGTRAAMRAMREELPAVMSIWSRFVFETIQGADVVVGGIGGMAIGLAAAERAGIPFRPAHLQPVFRASDRYPGVLVSGLPRWLGGSLRRMSHRVSDALIWMPFAGAMKKARADLGLPRRRQDPAEGQITLYGFSRLVVPMPEDDLHTVTGYWTLNDQDWSPPIELLSFLEDGPPAISIGFGSMGSSDAAALERLIAEAARSARMRVVLIGSQFRSRSDRLYSVADVPHEWLFNRMSANVHHGGAGTTGAGFRSGRPQLVVPFAVDQPFWGRRVATVGVGPAPLPRRGLTAVKLADKLVALGSSEAFDARAKSLGELLRAEDGVKAAVETFGDRT